MARERINVVGGPIARDPIGHFDVDSVSIQLDGSLKVVSLIVRFQVEGEDRFREAVGFTPGTPVQQLAQEIRRMALAEVEKLRTP